MDSNKVFAYQVDEQGYPILYAEVEKDTNDKSWVFEDIPRDIEHPKWNPIKEVWYSSAPRAGLFEEMKAIKKLQLSQACQNAILGYFKVDIDGVEYEFSYDREAQINLSERWQLFQNGVIESIVLTGHIGEEDTRLDVDKEMFDKIYIESVKHKENYIKRLRDDLYPLVDMSQSEEDLKSITWDMEILTPTPESIVVRDDKLLNDEVKRLEMESAQSGSELMGLIMMLGMGF